MLFYNIVNQIINYGIAILMSFGVASLINLILVKIKRILVFVLPGILFGGGAAMLLMGWIATDWEKVFLILFGTLAMIAFAGAMLSSLLFWFVIKKKPATSN